MTQSSAFLGDEEVAEFQRDRSELGSHTRSGVIDVLLADDHPIVREGLRTVLGAQEDIRCVGEAASAAEILELVARHKPDVVLMDLVMPGPKATDVIASLRLAHPRTQVVALTSFGDEARVRGVVDAGALGLLLKDASRDELLAAIRNASRGVPAFHTLAQRHLLRRVVRSPDRSPVQDLTTRERDVLQLIARGRDNKAIAGELRLSYGTVKGYVSRVLGKLGVADRTKAALLAIREGLAPPPGEDTPRAG